MANKVVTEAHLAALARLKQLEHLLDRQFSIGGFQFGVDSIVGLVPILGDLITGALGLYVISEARRIGVSRWTLARMYTNWGIDVSVGALPIVGDLFDLAFKSNTKNVRMLIAELETRARKYGRVGGTPLDLDIIEHEPVEASTKPGRAGEASSRPVIR